MQNYIKPHPWQIIEEGFDSKHNRASESLFSLGNGYMGQRACFEEHYSGDTLLGNYIAGIYYPDPTKVGWWKNGYPKYYARIVNIPNWISIDIIIDDEMFDLAKCKVSNFSRILHMDKGYLERSFTAKLASGKKIKVHCQRFLSMADKTVGAIKYELTPLNFTAPITVLSNINTNVRNENSNWNEKFLDDVSREVNTHDVYVTTLTRRSDFHICTGITCDIFEDKTKLDLEYAPYIQEQYFANKVTVEAKQDHSITIYKYAVNVTTRDHELAELLDKCKADLANAHTKGFATMFEEHCQIWQQQWERNDVIIEGDLAAQQAIRFNIMQLTQSYTGDDPRLNVGPKGFTGEKYGATTQWDSEAYCIPYYLGTATSKITKNLLLYRYHSLADAINYAKELGFTHGAALFPMATVNGQECQNEWEITFEEIHRNGAIAYAIYNYVTYTGDTEYLAKYGLEVLIAISRYWSQRATFSNDKDKFVILGVTGPNEYENNVNNNWYTNKIATWTMQYTIDSIYRIKKSHPSIYLTKALKNKFAEQKEIKTWQNIIANMYFPVEDKQQVFLQQEGYMDKEQILTKNLDPKHRPLNQHWSWDRILRSCFIKQADVLQGIYFFMDSYDSNTIKRNFDFYEPRTVHESSLSPCIHAILAARIGYLDKAYELFMRSTRLDLDDYNNEVSEGCHITSMAGAWLVIAHGFAGMRVTSDTLHFDPVIIPQWHTYRFKTLFRENQLQITVNDKQIDINNLKGKAIELVVKGKNYRLEENGQLNIA